MDISIPVGDTKLNVRVAVLLPTPTGYLFQVSPKGYAFPIGGRIKINETAAEAAARELEEEIQYTVAGLRLCGLVENFYKTDDAQVHEYSFVYTTDTVYDGPVPEGYMIVSRENVDDTIIRPTVIRDFIGSTEPFIHRIVR